MAAEAAGRTVVPPRMDVDLERGFLRVMPAAYNDLMGLKVMTLVRGLGTRYLILLYSQTSGELVAMFDADEVTRMRTAATTTLAGEMLAPGGCETLGLVGSGFEAEGHLRAFAAQWPLREVLVYSRARERREAFAARMSEELGIAVARGRDGRAGDRRRARSACWRRRRPSRSSTAPTSSPARSCCRSARRGPTCASSTPPRCGARRRCWSTTPRQVKLESGDVIEGLACGALTTDHVVGMAQADPAKLRARRRPRPARVQVGRDGDPGPRARLARASTPRSPAAAAATSAS